MGQRMINTSLNASSLESNSPLGRVAGALVAALIMMVAMGGPAVAQNPLDAIGNFFRDLGEPSPSVNRTRDPRDRKVRHFSDPRVSTKFRRTTVRYPSKHKTGTIVIDSRQKYLYLVQPNGRAIRYGVGVGREGFGWRGTVRVGRKSKWPTWTPPAAMIRREPYLKKYANGMPGGVNNPLGARALYLYNGGRDSLYRIHGTNEPWSIGRNVSSGCIRLNNHDIVHLYDRAQIGAKVVVI